MLDGYVEPTLADFIKNNLGVVLAGTFTILGVLASVYFGFDTWKKSEKEKFEKKQLDHKLEANTEELKAKAIESENRGREIQELNNLIIVAQQETIDKAQEIEVLNKKINNQLEKRFQPHVIYRYTGFENSSLKLIFINLGDHILRNPVLTFEYRARMTKGDQLLYTYESPLKTHSTYTDDVKFGWAPHKIWEVELFAGFPTHEIPEDYDGLYIEYRFKMEVNGYTSIKEDNDWLYTRTFVVASLINPEKNKIVQQFTEFRFHKMD